MAGAEFHDMARPFGEGAPEWVTPYTLRHTASSLLAKGGVGVQAAALGHDPAIYLRTYAHLYPGDLRSAADAMDAVRTAARNGKTGAPSDITQTPTPMSRADVTTDSRGDSAGMGISRVVPEAPASA